MGTSSERGAAPDGAATAKTPDEADAHARIAPAQQERTLGFARDGEARARRLAGTQRREVHGAHVAGDLPTRPAGGDAKLHAQSGARGPEVDVAETNEGGTSVSPGKACSSYAAIRSRCAGEARGIRAGICDRLELQRKPRWSERGDRLRLQRDRGSARGALPVAPANRRARSQRRARGNRGASAIRRTQLVANSPRDVLDRRQIGGRMTLEGARRPDRNARRDRPIGSPRAGRP